MFCCVLVARTIRDAVSTQDRLQPVRLDKKTQPVRQLMIELFEPSSEKMRSCLFDHVVPVILERITATNGMCLSRCALLSLRLTTRANDP